ncbi:MAG: adenylyl-sulfate kinase [Richelia sp. RM2_1_2]|nr:adenylyl-sulfate kinase [Richelia sp. SM2_1_7]NJM19762.1 adenylyl-sulfate kinase [Richelia sp. SM1_7_0]NJN08019.1 adenylyl-sulfate kinase [Richelia sp. RM1_1_1]NJO27821.1 adenylyl-sulfate kinase [Richelia sp. SL_2_1]NJO58692.1 adenylyl-sulfate kinase [Richelia sp. RM2_1_2]
MNNKGVTVWLTGLSGAGKTTIARRIEEQLKARNCQVEVLDGDLIRTWLSQGLGFSKKDRDINVRRVGFVANLLSRNGVVVIAAMISPYQEIRDEIRAINKDFVEVYVNAPLELCEARDVKGLYAKARSGEIKGFTGIDDPYEVPLNPEVVCESGKESVEESAKKVIRTLEELGYVRGVIEYQI